MRFVIRRIEGYSAANLSEGVCLLLGFFSRGEIAAFLPNGFFQFLSTEQISLRFAGASQNLTVLCKEDIRMNCRLVIFDMDGTVLDTLEDLTDATNYALSLKGFRTRTVDEIRAVVGNGVVNQIRKSLPPDADEGTVSEVVSVYKEYYTSHMNVKTRPYAGIVELLKRLRERNIQIGVSSNKFDPAAKGLSREYFGSLVDFTEGESPETPKKPDPTGTLKILRLAGAKKEETLYVGDSPTDVQTAKNAGLAMIAVTWGFRTREQLAEAGARNFIDRPDELIGWL